MVRIEQDLEPGLPNVQLVFILEKFGERGIVALDFKAFQNLLLNSSSLPSSTPLSKNVENIF